ncbi:conserved hypothetical protein [Culex quinquefasciatus]|uniref:Sensory neuron membrane protein 1 n=1 Tax=Culex quinquefasciatus TaxID=7176 RepID=B0XDR4_CULQU|nr:conserved hypothetical protein [Culex quinquefasciatus]|eukprot:XP_001867786.1 conserved hypothetical protein [Culex quinquefasciatus]
MNLADVNFKKITIICACTMIGGLTLSVGVFPALVQFMLKQCCSDQCPKMKLKNVNFRKVAIICACTMVVGLTVSMAILPELVNLMLRQNVLLKPGTQMRGMFEKMPFPLDFKIHLFNVSNPEEIMKGGKPKIKDVGPYYFEYGSG